MFLIGFLIEDTWLTKFTHRNVILTHNNNGYPPYFLFKPATQSVHYPEIIFFFPQDSKDAVYTLNKPKA